MSMPPKDDPQRRNARIGPLVLPAEGRKDPTPEWPLPGEPSAAESAAWGDLWATPQAVAWARLGWVRTVGRYCRVLVESEQPEARADVRAEARQLEDRLGLTPKAMRLMLWTVSDDQVGEKREERRQSSQSRHVRAVDPAAADA